MSASGDPVIEEIVSFHSKNEPQGIINVFRECVFAKDRRILSNLHLLTWPLPAEKDLNNFAHFVVSQNISRIYSIGCGTGLLEWLMLTFIEKEAEQGESCVKMVGVEIDGKWWESTYSPPNFISLTFYHETFYPEDGFGNESDLAMFCYFNNMKVFAEYLKSFRGNFVVIIGPISTEQFCAPGPRDLNQNTKELPTKEWNLLSCEQFGLIDIDHIAIYKRLQSRKKNDPLKC